MKKIIIAFIITISLVSFLLFQIDVSNIKDILKNVYIKYLFCGIVFYSITIFLRTKRFSFLLAKKVGLKDLFAIVCIQNTFNQIIPFRAGELSYLYFIKKIKGADSFSEGVPSLICARVFDIFSLSIVFFITLFGIDQFSEIVKKSASFIAVSLLIICCGVILLFLLRDKLLRIINEISMAMNIDKYRIVQWSLKKGKEVSAGFEFVRSKKVLAICFCYSFLILISMNFYRYFMYKALGLEFSVFTIVFITCFLILASLLPFFTIGGFGYVESIWAFLMINLNMDKNEAIATGFSYHLLSKMVVLIVFFICIFRFLPSISAKFNLSKILKSKILNK